MKEEGLKNPFHASKTEVEKIVSLKYYNSRKEKNYDLNYFIEDENEYYILLVKTETGFGTIVRKKFEGYNSKVA